MEDEALQPAPTGGQADALLSELTNRLMGQSDIIRSGQDRIAETFQDVRADIERGAAATETATMARFEGLREQQRHESMLERRGFQEAQRGFGVNNAMLREIRRESDRKVKELERMEMEALAQGNADTAQRLADLRMAELEFEQRAEQEIFNNMIASMGLAIQMQAGERDVQRIEIERDRLLQDERRILQDERMFMADLASRYGVGLEDGDTLTTLVNRVEERELTEREQMELDLMVAQIEGQRIQNERLQQQINLAWREATQQDGSIGEGFGFADAQRRREFLAEAAEVHANIRAQARMNPEFDVLGATNDLIDSLATKYAADVEGGLEGARAAARSALGMAPFAETIMLPEDVMAGAEGPRGGFPGFTTMSARELGEATPGFFRDMLWDRPRAAQAEGVRQLMEFMGGVKSAARDN